jgi:hypothetical protein
MKTKTPFALLGCVLVGFATLFAVLDSLVERVHSPTPGSHWLGSPEPSGAS